MVAGIIHEEWLNNNRNRKYPFMDDVSLYDTTGSLAVPNELIVDLVFPVHSITYDVSKFYVKELTISSDSIVVSLGYEGETDPIATRAITTAGHTENKTYYIEGIGNFIDSVGRITIGRLTAAQQYGGHYEFDVAATRLLPTVLRPSLKGVNALRVVSASNEQSDLIQGNVEILAGDNIQLTLITPPSGAKKLRISAIPSTDYEAECDCGDAGTGQCIETINSIGPDETGNLTVETLECVSWNPLDTGISLEDTCADPCCGCKELQVLNDELARLAAQVTTQQAFAQRAQSNVEQLRDVILVSRLGNVVECP